MNVVYAEVGGSVGGDVGGLGGGEEGVGGEGGMQEIPEDLQCMIAYRLPSNLQIIV